MGRVGFAVIVVVTANTLTAGSLMLCVENPAQLDESTMKAFQKELGAVLAASGRPDGFTPCRPGIVTITLRDRPPDEEASALGGIRRRNGRLVPEIELFVAPTAQIVGSRLPGVLGRALARVAAHELGHWLSRSSEHSARGVMMERLSAAHLMTPDRAFFRIPPGD